MMIHSVLNDFSKVGSVDIDIIKKYSRQLPNQIIDIWKELGFGTFYNGYLKVVNPDDYIEIIKKSYYKGDISFPIMVTAFGDIITWESDGYACIIKYRYGESDVISSGFEYFFDIIADEECASDYFTIKKFESAVKKYGDLEYDECFGYVPLLALGGKESVNNLKKVKIREHIAMIFEFIGEI